MLPSVGLALTASLVCSMVGMLALMALDYDPELARKKNSRSFILSGLIAIFAVLCLILFRLRPPLPIFGLFSLGTLMFMWPAFRRLNNPDSRMSRDRSPWLWRWRTRLNNRRPESCLRKLEKIERQFAAAPLDPILHLKALELSLACNENTRALYHCHVLDEILDRGSAHEHTLRAQLFIMSHRQRRNEDAEKVLKRIDSLYPIDFQHDLPPRREETSTPGSDQDS